MSYSAALAATGGTAPFTWALVCWVTAHRTDAQYSRRDQRSAHDHRHVQLHCEGHRLDESRPDGNRRSDPAHPSDDECPRALGRCDPSGQRGDARCRRIQQNGIATVQFEISGGSIVNKVVGTATGTLFGYLLRFDTTPVPERDLHDCRAWRLTTRDCRP